SAGRTSLATSRAACLRSSDVTSPIRKAFPPETLIVMSSTFVRGSVAKASRMRPTRCFASIAPDPTPSAFVDFPVQLAHDMIWDVHVERVRVDQEAQHAPRGLTRAAEQVVPVELVHADQAERVVPVTRPLLVVHGRFDDEQVLGRDEADW